MSHKAIVAAISAIKEIPGADNIHEATVLGEQVVVSKAWGVGQVGIFFPVDVQLSEDFCRENNLFRRSHLNKDSTQKGFFDDNRRVRAQPFLKVKSCGLFMPLTSLSYTGFKCVNGVGHTFDEIEGHKICQKYYSEETKAAKSGGVTKQAKRNYAPFFEKHVDSEQFKHYAEKIPVGALLHFHAKVHGTSARMGYLPVLRDLPFWKEKINKTLKREIFKPKMEYDYVVGTRNVILQNSEKEGFHGSEQFRFDVLEMVKPYLTKGMTIYGEIAGFANGKPIMATHNVKALKNKNFEKKYGDTMVYSYGCKEHQFRFHVYRITQMIEGGEHIDYSQAQIDKFCERTGLNGPLQVHTPYVYTGDVAELRVIVDTITEREAQLTEDYIDSSHISEGIIIRVDKGSFTPDFYKNKSFAFKVMEGMVEAVDTEDAA